MPIGLRRGSSPLSRSEADDLARDIALRRCVLPRRECLLVARDSFRPPPDASMQCGVAMQLAPRLIVAPALREGDACRFDLAGASLIYSALMAACYLETPLLLGRFCEVTRYFRYFRNS